MLPTLPVHTPHFVQLLYLPRTSNVHITNYSVMSIVVHTTDFQKLSTKNILATHSATLTVTMPAPAYYIGRSGSTSLVPSVQNFYTFPSLSATLVLTRIYPI